MLFFTTGLESWTADVRTVYGKADSAKVCADAILDAAGIPTEFPKAALELARQLDDRGILQQESLKAAPICAQ